MRSGPPRNLGLLIGRDSGPETTRSHTFSISLFIHNTVPNLLRIIAEWQVIVLSCQRQAAFLCGSPVRENRATIYRYNNAFYQRYGYYPLVFNLILYRVV